MEIQEQCQGAVTVLKPVGPLVEPDAQQLKQQLSDLARRNMGRIVLDASAVPYADSSGIEALVDVTDLLSEGGRSLKLCGASETVRLVLRLTGWADAFEFYDDVNGAVRSFL